MREIDSNPALDDEQKDEAKQKLINSLELERYCCKMRVLTYTSEVDLFK